MTTTWNNSRALLLFLLITAILSIPDIGVANNTLRGEAFSDPSYIQAMPKSWEDTPIMHSPEIGTVDLSITLDQHLYPTLYQLIIDYGQENNLQILINEGTCGITAGKLTRKSSDIGGFCCPPGKTDRFPGLVFHTVGITPIALLVHPDNDINTVSLSVAREIFQGEIYRWSELKNQMGQPGPNLTIQTIGRLHCKIRPGHWRLLLDNEDLFSARLQEVGTIPDMISLIANAPGAIGYEVMMMVQRYQREGKVKPLSINGFMPTGKNLLDGNYPFYRTLNITTWEGEKTKNRHAEKLITYLLDRAQYLKNDLDIVPATKLRQAGWQFKANELIGEPKK